MIRILNSLVILFFCTAIGCSPVIDQDFLQVVIDHNRAVNSIYEAVNASIDGYIASNDGITDEELKELTELKDYLTYASYS